MGKYTCYVCGKTPLTKDEIGITKKLIDKKTTQFYCDTYTPIMRQQQNWILKRLRPCCHG